MPIYEYKCSDCGHVLDALQGVNDAPLEECPKCSEKSLKKLISAPNFRLSGEGWYETDFKTGNKKNIAKSDNESTSSKKSTEKKEDKPKKASS